MPRWTWVAAAFLALACGRGAEPASAGAPPDGQPASAPAGAARGERVSDRRGDRHARAATRRSLPVRRTEGRIAQASERLVVIRRREGADLTLRVAPGTAVTVNGTPSRAGELKQGAEVRASYRRAEGRRPTAVSIEAAEPAPAPRDGRAAPPSLEPPDAPAPDSG